MQTGGTSSPFSPSSALASHSTLTSPLFSLFLLLLHFPSYLLPLPPSPISSLPLTILPRRRKLHIAVLSYFKWIWVGS